jgi:hypothetical protein
MIVGAELNSDFARKTKMDAIEEQPELPVITKLDLTHNEKSTNLTFR